MDVPEDFEANLEQYEQALYSDPPLAESFLAYYQGELAGCAVFNQGFSVFSGFGVLNVLAVYVREAFRTKYVAFGIYLYLLELARVRGLGQVDGLVDAWNKPLHDFYRVTGAYRSETVLYELYLNELDEEQRRRIMRRYISDP